MAVGRSGILGLLVTLSLATAAQAATAETVAVSVPNPASSAGRPEDGKVSDASPFQDEAYSSQPCSESCSKRSSQCCPNDCCGDCCECCDPRWTVTADALFLHRSATRGQRLLFDPLNGTDLLNSTDLAFSYEAGPRLSLVRHGLGGWDFELNYFGIDAWKAGRDFPASAFPGGVGSLIWIMRSFCRSVASASRNTPGFIAASSTSGGPSMTG